MIITTVKERDAGAVSYLPLNLPAKFSVAAAVRRFAKDSP
jgi:hypothetical protein